MLMPEKQVTSGPLSIALYRAGVKRTTQYYWVNDRLITLYQLHCATTFYGRPYAAYGTAEVGSLLPVSICNGKSLLRVVRTQNGWDVFYPPAVDTPITTNKLYSASASTLPEATGLMVLHMIKDGVITNTGKAA